jgi:hypothetical protein
MPGVQISSAATMIVTASSSAALRPQGGSPFPGEGGFHAVICHRFFLIQ